MYNIYFRYNEYKFENNPSTFLERRWYSCQLRNDQRSESQRERRDAELPPASASRHDARVSARPPLAANADSTRIVVHKNNLLLE